MDDWQIKEIKKKFCKEFRDHRFGRLNGASVLVTSFSSTVEMPAALLIKCMKGKAPTGSKLKELPETYEGLPVYYKPSYR